MDNPYSAPSSNPSGRESFGFTQEGVTQGVVSQLARTKGWVRFLGVLGFIGSGFMILIGVVVLAMGQSIGKGMAGQGPLSGPGFMHAAGIFYVVFGLLYFYPALKLNSYATAISRLVFTGSSADLEDAIEQQRAFWKFAGVVLLLMLVTFAATIIIMTATILGNIPK